MSLLPPVTQVMKEQLTGNCAALPDLPAIETPDDRAQVAVHVLSSAAKIAESWVGVNIMETARALGYSVPALVHPVAWVVLYRAEPVLVSFRLAESAGFCTISEGYAWPTQLLADRLLDVA